MYVNITEKIKSTKIDLGCKHVTAVLAHFLESPCVLKTQASKWCPKFMLLCLWKRNKSIWIWYHRFTIRGQEEKMSLVMFFIYLHTPNPANPFLAAKPCLGWHCWSPKLLQVRSHSPSMCPGTMQQNGVVFWKVQLYINLPKEDSRILESLFVIQKKNVLWSKNNSTLRDVFVFLKRTDSWTESFEISKTSSPYPHGPG